MVNEIEYGKKGWGAEQIWSILFFIPFLSKNKNFTGQGRREGRRETIVLLEGRKVDKNKALSPQIIVILEW